MSDSLESWEALCMCFERVAHGLDTSLDDAHASRFMRGLIEAFAAVVAVAVEQRAAPPVPEYFCCCEKSEAKGAICIIHGAMALQGKP